MASQQMAAAQKKKMADAVAYLQKVKTAFHDRITVYNEFVRLLNLLKTVAGSRDSHLDITARIEAMLAEKPELLEGFSAFNVRPPPSAIPAEPLGKGEGTSAEPITFDDSAAEEEEEEAAATEEEEVVITGSSGVNALTDLPHSRHSCVVCPLPAAADAAAAMAHCPRCYCYLCDRPVGECRQWRQHSCARDEEGWRRVRDAMRAPPSVPPPAVPRLPFKRPRIR
mmetsp:Transcript_22367/g.67137  ORF Transcript_22367/g.67137 Transcript_22367/m.67137 type:complete len:225 (+) Transcript_22367:330-1004(+)